MTGVVVLGLWLGSIAPCDVAWAEPDSTPAAKGAAASAPTAVGSPQAEMTPDAAAAEATAKAKAAVAASCQKTAAGLNSADLAALKALPTDKQTMLMHAPAAANLMACLTIAENDDRFCKMLADTAQRDKCVQHWKDVRELKALPKEQLKAHLIYQSCIGSTAKADCETVRDAMAAGDAAKCAALSSAPLRAFCAAIATGDASKCKTLPAGEERGRCEAYATEDETRCPKDSGDCRNLARSFAAIRKSGLGAVEDIDPTTAAAVKGRQSCAPYVTEFEHFCTEQD